MAVKFVVRHIEPNSGETLDESEHSTPMDAISRAHELNFDLLMVGYEPEYHAYIIDGNYRIELGEFRWEEEN